MDEAVANFFAARSITGNDNAFICGCRDVYYPAHCSDAAALILLGDPEQDGVGSCTNGALAGIGDVFANSPANCTYLAAQGQGCNCFISPSDPYACHDEFRLSTGWRNEIQNARFLWDVIDSGTDGGADNDDLTTSQLIAELAAAPCSGSDQGVNNTCNEPLRLSLNDCIPVNDKTGVPPGVAMGTRDSYNPYDLSVWISGNQLSERILNCVQGATD
jgi:hypothetical protein